MLLFHLDPDNPIDDELLRQILFENSSESSDYIRITTALWCCRKNPKYLATYQAAVRAIERIAQQFDELSLARCEIVMLLFDIVSCPYLDKDTKENFVKSLIVATSESKKSEVSSRSTVTQTISYIEANLGFCEWQEFDRLGGLLRRRELRTVYE